MKKIPKLRFKEFSGEWKSISLGEIGKIIRGASPRPQGDPRFYGGSIPRLMVKDVTRDGKYVTPQIDFLTEEGAMKSRPCKKGTLTIVCSGTVGIPSILAVDACIHDGFLAIIDIDPNVSIDYLFQKLSTLQEQFDQSATHGGVFTNLTTTLLSNFQVTIPSHTEQIKVSHFLDSVDERIRQLKRKKELLEQYKKGVMQQLFSGKIRFKDENGKEFPEWEEKRLGDVAEINPRSNGLPSRFIYIDLESVIKGELVSEKEISISEAPSRAQRVLKKKDILYQTVRPYQLNNLLFNRDGDYVASTGYAQLRTTHSPEFVYQLMHTASFTNEVLDRCTGTSFPAIKSDSLSKIAISVPCLSEQQKIASFLSAIDDQIELVGSQIEKSQTFKKGLLQQMFV